MSGIDLSKATLWLAAAIVLQAVPVKANDSIYTDLDMDRCATLEEQEEGGGISLKCKGLGRDYPVYFKEGDLRQTVLFGPVNDAYLDGAFESFSAFNSAGKTIEWRRTAAKRPFATILRWFVENIDPDTGMPAPALSGQILVISKIAGADGKGCVVGYVDAVANGDANALARSVADDMAQAFRCGADEPVFHGKRGEKSSEPTRSLPEE